MRHWVNTLTDRVLLALVPFWVSIAGTLEDGVAAYQKGDYAAALRRRQHEILEIVVDRGTPYADALDARAGLPIQSLSFFPDRNDQVQI
jgi:hypothetical protein